MKNFRKNCYYVIAAVIFLVLILIVFSSVKKEPQSFHFSGSGQNEPIILEESKSMNKSSHSDWWLNSGGILNVYKNEFSTNLGKLDKNSTWRKTYAKNNSRDTDKGYYPQNIFRLVTKSQWKNFTQQVYFKIEKINLSKSKYRNESNGVLFFNRYQDGDNLYYAGLRADGHAVIKKKINGDYYTLAEKKVLTNGGKYDRTDNPNLLPENKWIGIKSEIKNLDRKTASIKLCADLEGKGDWQLILEVKDRGDKKGGAPFLKRGYAGIRTDFMDVKFKDYNIIEN